MAVTAAAPSADYRVKASELDQFCRASLRAAGADDATAIAAARAMMHGSRFGIDSHGVRLLDHYVRAIEHGRIAGKPQINFPRVSGGTALLDADNGHGALGAYAAMERACAMAREQGIGAVAVTRSSHFGAAGAFALAAANEGLIGLCVCAASALVRLHDGAERFHGTNPIAFAAPVKGDRPWLLDMATSAAAFNKVKLYHTLGRALPSGVASDAEGRDTQDPDAVSMLAPLGGEFGYKGAGLAGMIDILSSALTGMAFSFEMMSMFGTDMSQPRRVGAFLLAMDPRAFAGETYDRDMQRYLERLRSSQTVPGRKVMAPGDREWAEADRRERDGIPLDSLTVQEFADLAKRRSLRAPKPL